MKSKFLIAAIAFPIVGLTALAYSKQMRVWNGVKLEFPIEGYDPRDVLSGHYLTYNVIYGIASPCSGFSDQTVYMCFDTATPNVMAHADDCKKFIRGTCAASGRFSAGIEHFYIPEARATELDRLVRDKKTKIIVSVTPDGQAQVVDLVVNQNAEGN